VTPVSRSIAAQQTTANAPIASPTSLSRIGGLASSEDAARAWTAEHEGTFELSIHEGFELGRFWAERAFGSR
jgi:hypothetical protein